METIKQTIYLYAAWDQYRKAWGYHATETSSMENCGWVKVESKEVEFDHPGADADWSAGAIELTRREQARIRAEAQAKCNALDERIQSMLALECKVTA
jgi:hypothetical protein